MTHVLAWKFRPPPGGEDAFADAYGPGGRWAALFGRSEGFLGTSLLRPAGGGGWWLTLDRWSDRNAFERFGARFGDEYRALDRELEGIAGDELFVGAFEEAG